MKLRPKMILTTVIGGILVLSSGLLITSYVGTTALRSEIGENFQSLAKEVAHKVDLSLTQEIRRLNDLLPLLAEDLRKVGDPPELGAIESGILEWNRERRGEVIEDSLLRKKNSDLLRRLMVNEIAQGKLGVLFVVDRKGALAASINFKPSYFHGNDTWWKRAIDPERGLVFLSDIYRFEDRFVFDIVLPIIDEVTVETLGVLKAVVDLKNFLEEPIHQIRFGETGHAMLVDASGTVLICPILATGSHISNVSLVETVSSPTSGWLQAEDDGHGGSNSIVGFAPTTKINRFISSGGSSKLWHSFIRQDPRESFLPIRTLQTYSALAGVGLIALMACTAIFLADRVARPIVLLRDGVKRIGRGELHHRLPTSSGDEIGELAFAFNKMADQIYESTVLMEQKISDRTDDLALINEVSRVANRSLDLQETLKDTLAVVVNRISADAGYIGVYGMEHRLSEGRGSHEEWVGTSGDVIKAWGQQRKKTVLLRRPVIVNPKTTPPDGTVLPLLNAGYKEVISIPILAGKGPLGILSLARKDAPFSPDTIDLLSSVSRPIGMAAQNSQLYEKSKELDQLKTDLISNVSHEIRTPMTSILGYAELLESEDLDPSSRQRFLSIIGQAGGHLLSLLDDLLDLSKLSSDKMVWDIIPINLKQLLFESVNLAKPLADKQGLGLRIEPCSNLPLIHGDQEHLRRVVVNLLSNAIKFTPSGEVVVGVTQNESFVEVFVRDTGGGIEPEDRERIFEKFYQVIEKQEGKPKGTGLGLPICREIITHLGGKIWCESVPGEGSTFFFTLQVGVPVKKDRDI